MNVPTSLRTLVLLFCILVPVEAILAAGSWLAAHVADPWAVRLLEIPQWVAGGMLLAVLTLLIPAHVLLTLEARSPRSSADR